MCIVLGMVAPFNSGVTEVMNALAEDLYNLGKRVTMLSSFNQIRHVQTNGVDYVILRNAINAWNDLKMLHTRFGNDNIRLFTHVPLWKGETKRGISELVDVNWNTWCAVRSVASTQMPVSLINIRRAFYAMSHVNYQLPKMIRAFNVISIANQDVVNIPTSCKVMEASLDDIAQVYQKVNTLNPTVHQMKLMMMVTLGK